jgi:hypothetical protein
MMLCELQDLLVRPGTFFAKMAGQAIDLAYPALIVFAGGLAGLANPGLVNLFSGAREGLWNRVLMPEAILVSLLMPFIAWILVAGILFVLCRLLSGTGSFPATLQNTGYGYLPLTLLPFLIVLIGIAIGRSGDPPGSAGAGVVIGLGLLSVLFVIWSGYLWMHAMEQTHAIPHGRAMAAAAIAVLWYMSPVLLNIIAISSPAGYFPG